MDVLSSITNFLGGGLFSGLKDLITDYLPPGLSDEQKKDFELKLNELLHKKELEANKAINDASNALNKRIAEQEGTAKDLKEIPILGSVMLFLRGVQRPAWGFLTMYLDLKWFFAGYQLNEQQQTALIVINTLVLGFLFGERSIKNLEPLILKVFTKK